MSSASRRKRASQGQNPRKRRKKSGSTEALFVEIDIACSSDQDELMGPGGWRPTLQDLAHQDNSRLIDDLPFNTTTPRNILRLASTASNLKIADSITSTLAAVQQSLEDTSLGKSPGADNSVEIRLATDPQCPQRKWNETDVRHFKESIRQFLRHILGVQPRTPAARWPRPSPSSPLQLDLQANGTLDTVIIERFSELYIHAYQNQSFPTMKNVIPTFVSKAWVETMFIRHIKELKRTIKNPSSPLQLRVKRHTQRRREKYQRRFTFLQSKLGNGLWTDLLGKLDTLGMSEDESDQDETGPFIRRKEPEWRSYALSTFLHNIDDVERVKRIRTVEELTSYPQTITELPVNFYCPKWLLLHHGNDDICQLPSVVFPSFDVNGRLHV